jgi:CrcB protein
LKLLVIALGGAVGAILRYYLSGFAYQYLKDDFPWGTLLVNLLGAFIIGYLWGIFEEVSVSVALRTFILVGMIGAFTTFSTYALETFNLLREGEIKSVLLNILVSNLLGIMLVWIGYVSSKYSLILIKGGR